MTPGIHKNVKFEDYLKIPAVSQSTLKKMMPTAKHCRHELDFPSEPTPAMQFGTALHDACLLPARIETDYVTHPKVDRRTLKGKAAWAEFEAASRDKVLLNDEQMHDIKACLKSLQSHPIAHRLLHVDAVARELTIIWKDEETGLLCKARIDVLSPWEGFLAAVDLKSTKDAGAGFSREIDKYRYDIQSSFYLDGLNHVSAPMHRPWLFVAVENFAPYCVAVYELSQEAIELGRETYRALLNRYAKCVETGKWPGYPERVEEISLPHWRFREHDIIEP